MTIFKMKINLLGIRRTREPDVAGGSVSGREMTPTGPGQPPDQLAPKDVTGSAARPFADVIGWFGERSVPVSLTASGIAILSLAVALRENSAQTWTLPTFLGLLGFGALLVIAGCAERVVMIHAYRTSHIRVTTVLRVSLDNLQSQAVKLAAATPAPLAPHGGDAQQAQGYPLAEIENEIQRIRVLATTSPYIALAQLANRIKESASTGTSAHSSEASSAHDGQPRRTENAIPVQPGTLLALRSFSFVQQELLKRPDDVDDDDVLCAIDSGAIILRSLTLMLG